MAMGMNVLHAFELVHQRRRRCSCNIAPSPQRRGDFSMHWVRFRALRSQRAWFAEHFASK